ncbi:MAG: hypothetical protein HZB70_01120 [Candidatus Berkelbacteria bacterium]|nr:MAG: hypothetical protein HZB70_01120 [Candidatus Berkelbacteria bacterium]QQG52060.1 MAG: hypothetical protein HY845_01875 [Candidatus Berkelbacteria bacterium]
MNQLDQPPPVTPKPESLPTDNVEAELEAITPEDVMSRDLEEVLQEDAPSK